MNIYTDSHGTTDRYQAYKQLYESRRGCRPAVFRGAGGSPHKRVKGFRPGDHSAVVLRQQLGERRMDEMRRDDFLKTGGPDLPPFAENLVFWAPLTNGDLTDHISGASLLCDSRVSYLWDTNENCYKFTMASDLQSGRGAYFNGVTYPFGSDINSMRCTFVADIKMVSNNPIQMPLMRYNNSFWSIGYSSYDPMSMSFNTWYRVCAIKDSDGTTGKIYANSVFGENFNAAASLSQMSQFMLFYYPGWSNRGTFYLKNCYVFNVALTLEEVAQL
jgi:hypothetical protein